MACYFCCTNETPWLVLADAGTGWITASTKVQASWDGFATPQLCAQLCTRSFWWKPWKNCCLSASIGISLILWFNHAAMELLSATGQLSETQIWKMVRFCFCCRPTWAHTAKIHGKSAWSLNMFQSFLYFLCWKTPAVYSCYAICPWTIWSQQLSAYKSFV